MNRLEAARKKLRGRYLANLITTSDSLEQAITEQSESHVAAICHDLKGSGSSFGFEDLTALALETESHRGTDYYLVHASTLVALCRKIASQG